MNKSDLRFTIGLIIIVLAPLVGHELVHMQISNNYGCQPTLDLVPSWEEGYFFSVSSDCTNQTQVQVLMHRQAQSSVEASGYQLMIIGIPLLIIAYMTYWKLCTVLREVKTVKHIKLGQGKPS